MDERNVPSAVVEILTPQGSLGTWLVSGFLDELQSLKFDNRTYQVGLRLTRYYKPFYIELIKFSHDKYLGTDIPKNFPAGFGCIARKRERIVKSLIYMNNPLRYWGKRITRPVGIRRIASATILQVVRNPSWLTPYLSCALVALGLVVQFLSHLICVRQEIVSESDVRLKYKARDRFENRRKIGAWKRRLFPSGPGALARLRSFPAGSKRRTL